MGRRLTKHHIRPKVKGGKGKPKNTIKIPQGLHDSWHSLFGSFLPKEAVNFSGEFLMPDAIWQAEELIKRCPDIRERRKLLASKVAIYEVAGISMVIPESYFNHWINFFGNLHCQQVPFFIEEIMRPGKRWTQELLVEKRETYLIPN